MGNAVLVKYNVVVEVDPDVWESNYGTNDTADIKTYMSEVIAELTNEYFKRSGNTGYARVSKR